MDIRTVRLCCLSALLALFVVVYARTVHASPESELETEVGSLNRAVQVYLEWGGDLDSVTDPRQVIAKLQTISDSNDIPKFKGVLVDAEMAPVMQNPEEALEKQPRILWHVEEKRFEIALTGMPGIKFFVFE